MDTVGPYRLEALVGRGTNGSVWRATRTGPVDHEVAVKRARAGPEGADRLRREAQVLVDLDHPHVVRIIDVLDDGEGLAIVMSLARGGSLHDLLDERGRLDAGATVAVLARVADALASAHRHGIFHGDVKPANILFTTDGEPLLGDFGVAQLLTPARGGPDGGPTWGDPVPQGSVEGTVGYVDPVLVETGRPDPRNDVYGLAVVAYLCLTGRLPHVGDGAGEVLAAAAAGRHPDLRGEEGVPLPLAELVEAALARDPDLRPASAGALAAGLRASIPSDHVVLPGAAQGRAAPDVGSEVDGGSDEAHEPDGLPEADAAPSPSGTRVFGPRPPRPDQEGDRGRPLVSGLVVVVLVAAAVGGGLWVRSRLGASQDPTSVTVEGQAEPDGVGCVALPPLDAPPGSQVLTADLAGDGCDTQVVWDGRVMRFRVGPDEDQARSYQVASEGGPGQLVLGDWDCDGAETPAFYQPATGQVAYFAEVPEREGGEVEARTEDSGITDGRAVLADVGDGECDSVQVTAEA